MLFAADATKEFKVIVIKDAPKLMNKRNETNVKERRHIVCLNRWIFPNYARSKWKSNYADGEVNCHLNLFKIY